MKYIFGFLLVAVALLGASCQAPREAVETVEPAPVYSVKAEYESNLDAKVADLAAHIVLVKERRAGLSANSVVIFDEQVTALDQVFAGLVQALADMKTAPEAAFMEERAKVNEQLQKTEDLYLKIITDYKIEIAA